MSTSAHSSRAIAARRSKPPRLSRARPRARSRRSKEMLEPLLSLTLSPTMISAPASAPERDPHVCEVADCRSCAWPGSGRGGAAVTRRSRRGRLRGFEMDRGPWWNAVARSDTAVGRGPRLHVRGGAIPSIPCCPCASPLTDSHWLREAFGTVAYGFFPMRAMDPQLAARLIHSADEQNRGRRPRACRSLLPPRGRPGDGLPLALFRNGGQDPPRRNGHVIVNGVLVHGPSSWACAIRPRPLKVNWEHKRLRASGVSNPLLRGPAKMAEVFAQVRRRAPGGALFPAATGYGRDGTRRASGERVSPVEPART